MGQRHSLLFSGEKRQKGIDGKESKYTFTEAKIRVCSVGIELESAPEVKLRDAFDVRSSLLPALFRNRKRYIILRTNYHAGALMETEGTSLSFRLGYYLNFLTCMI